MNNSSSHSVVDQMIAELAERRHTRIHRHAAYLALARAIVTQQELEMPTQSVFDPQVTPIRSAVAA
jgi:hypothetical protein